MKSLLLLHGALGAGEDLIDLEQKLLSPHLKLFRFTFQGHARRAFTTPFGIESFANELLEFVVQNNIEKPYVFGYSMGGYVALQAALKNKQAFSGVVTLGTKFNWSPAFVAKERSKLLPDVLVQKAPEFAEALIKKHGESWASLLDATSAMMQDLEHSSAGFLNNLAALDLPVWIGRGDRDKMVDMEESILVTQALNRSGLYVLPETPHALEQVNLHMLAGVLRSFVMKQ